MFAVVAACYAGDTGFANVAGLVLFFDADVAALFSALLRAQAHAQSSRQVLCFVLSVSVHFP